jgi:hypothetical protein
MDPTPRALRTGVRNAWIVLALGFVYVGLFLALAIRFDGNPPPVTWDFGGTSFVPASSPQAEGYHLPVPAAPVPPDSAGGAS